MIIFKIIKYIFYQNLIYKYNKQCKMCASMNSMMCFNTGKTCIITCEKLFCNLPLCKKSPIYSIAWWLANNTWMHFNTQNVLNLVISFKLWKKSIVFTLSSIFCILGLNGLCHTLQILTKWVYNSVCNVIRCCVWFMPAPHTA